MAETWYRYFEEIEDGCCPRIRCLRYPVVKVTPHGVWLDLGPWRKKKFVLRDARKRWACPTTEEARHSFRARKLLQKRFLLSKISSVEAVLDIPDDEYPV